MVEKKTSSGAEDETGIEYEIKIKGLLKEHWADWMGGLRISHDMQGNSLLTGFVPDQAALHGILNQIRDLGLSLVSITPQSVEDRENEENNENPE